MSTAPRQPQRRWPPSPWPTWLQIVALLPLCGVVFAIERGVSLSMIPLLLLLFTMHSTPAHWPTEAPVRWVEGITIDHARQLLESPMREVVHLDGREIHDAAGLARALDATLSSFEHPTEPMPHALAHIGFEARSSGWKTIVWTDARNLVDHDPATFAAFLAAWRDRITPNRRFDRVLVIDLPDPSGSVVEAA